MFFFFGPSVGFGWSFIIFNFVSCCVPWSNLCNQDRVMGIFFFPLPFLFLMSFSLMGDFQEKCCDVGSNIFTFGNPKGTLPIPSSVTKLFVCKPFPLKDVSSISPFFFLKLLLFFSNLVTILRFHECLFYYLKTGSSLPR